MKHRFAMLALVLAVLIPFANFGTVAAASAQLSPMNGTLTISLGTNVTEYKIYQCNILAENPNSSPLSASFTFRADAGYGNFSGKYYRLNADGRVDDGGSTNVVATQTSSVLPAGAVEWQLPVNQLVANSAMGIVFADNARGYFSDDNIETAIYDGGIRVDNTSPNNADFTVSFAQELGSTSSPLVGAYYTLNASSQITGIATAVTATQDNNPLPGGGENWVLDMKQMGGRTSLVISLCGNGAAVATPAVIGGGNATCSYVLGEYTANTTVNQRTGPGTSYGLFGQVQAGATINIVALDTTGCWGKTAMNYWVSLNLFTYGSHPAPTGNACQYVPNTGGADGTYTFESGVTYSAPIMIVVPKLPDGRNQFSARQVVRGSWTTPANGGHVWRYAAECDIQAELDHVPTTP